MTAMAFGLKVGLLIGVVTAIVTLFMPFIERGADHVPAKRMGVVGIVMILIGFALQSVQYWVTLMGVQIRR
jgi:cbb3-type cytochrome oxidase subunit 1